jgi:hypothetical protein
VHQVLVVLVDTDPLVWRRIQVPGRYSFWDFHVAIQDAMGWEDYHLHEFTVPLGGGGTRRIGIPDDECSEERPTEAGWDVGLSEVLKDGALPIRYLYDFGDNWERVVVHEGTWRAERGVRYPRCVSGGRACPPEDCGGPWGYADYLVAMRDRRHPRHEELFNWRGAFDPDAFSASDISFDDPR